MTGFLARKMLNYLALSLLATFLAYALASLTGRGGPSQVNSRRHPGALTAATPRRGRLQP